MDVPVVFSTVDPIRNIETLSLPDTRRVFTKIVETEWIGERMLLLSFFLSLFTEYRYNWYVPPHKKNLGTYAAAFLAYC